MSIIPAYGRPGEPGTVLPDGKLSSWTPTEERAMAVPCVGDVWRHPTIVPFGDHVVLKVEGDQVLLARPFAVASEYSRQPWLSAEVYSLPVSHLNSGTNQWKLVAAGCVR